VIPFGRFMVIGVINYMKLSANICINTEDPAGVSRSISI
jgi:hypothetical protein